MNIIAFVLGTIFGSFLGVIIDRLPSGRNIATGRSQCDSCSKTLGPLDLIPIFSFLKSKARCAYCKSPLSWRYLHLELITGLAYLLVYLKTGIQIEFILGAILASLLIVIAYIDIDTIMIYDRFHVLILILGLCFWILDPGTLNSRLLGMVIVSIPYLILAIVTKGIGGGDVKLIAAAGFLLAWPNTLLAFILATLLGGVYGIYLLLSKKSSAKDAIPFGPYLCIGIFIAYLYGPMIINFYISLF